MQKQLTHPTHVFLWLPIVLILSSPTLLVATPNDVAPRLGGACISCTLKRQRVPTGTATATGINANEGSLTAVSLSLNTMVRVFDWLRMRREGDKERRKRRDVSNNDED